MAAGREAARAAAIEVISDGLFFFEWVQSRLYAGVFKGTMGWKPAKLAAFSEFYYAPQVDHISSRQCGTFSFWDWEMSFSFRKNTSMLFMP